MATIRIMRKMCNLRMIRYILFSKLRVLVFRIFLVHENGKKQTKVETKLVKLTYAVLIG